MHPRIRERVRPAPAPKAKPTKKAAPTSVTYEGNVYRVGDVVPMPDGSKRKITSIHDDGQGFEGARVN